MSRINRNLPGVSTLRPDALKLYSHASPSSGRRCRLQSGKGWILVSWTHMIWNAPSQAFVQHPTTAGSSATAWQPCFAGVQAGAGQVKSVAVARSFLEYPFRSYRNRSAQRPEYGSRARADKHRWTILAPSMYTAGTSMKESNGGCKAARGPSNSSGHSASHVAGRRVWNLHPPKWHGRNQYPKIRKEGWYLAQTICQQLFLLLRFFFVFLFRFLLFFSFSFFLFISFFIFLFSITIVIIIFTVIIM